MRFATIDLGSNTVRLLIVEASASGRWRIVEQDQRVTRLGEGVRATGTLADAPMARTTEIVSKYVARAARHRAHDIRIVATSAVREAANGTTFTALVERLTGRRVEVISGEEEARLTLRGVMCGLDLPRGGRILLFDIGGGSSEYVVARDGAVEASVSLRLGVVGLAERFPFSDGLDAARYAEMAAEIASRLDSELPAAIRQARIDQVVGTAGTVTTLGALDLGLDAYDASRVQGHVLHRDAIEALLARLGALPVAARAALPCLEPGRADLILPGLAIVVATLAVARVDRLVVSDYGLREGVIADLVQGAR